MLAAIAMWALAACDYARVAALPGPDAGDDATGDAGDPACTEGARRCEGNLVTTCADATWVAAETCSNYCDAGACITPPSCGGGNATCGAEATEACCRALAVPATTFARSYDGVSSGFTDPQFRATVSAFALDKYEVNVTRLQAFVDAYPADQPAAGAGKNPHDASDPGWRAEWTAQLPATRAALVSQLGCTGAAQVAVDAARCASWYVAQAFCIWDGGRLPTEAEWNAAAAGGEEQRVYPWSSPPASPAITSAQAGYGGARPDRPGAHSPAGDGRWGHADLAGNLWEWVFDYYATPYPSDSCADCANQTVSPYRGNRGGSYVNAAASVIVSLRGALQPEMTDATVGFRCARNPTP